MKRPTARVMYLPGRSWRNSMILRTPSTRAAVRIPPVTPVYSRGVSILTVASA